jgi:hypothetical protein
MHLSLNVIVRMEPVEAGFLQRLDGNIDLGFSCAGANVETRWTLNTGVSYRARLYSTELTLASQLTERDDASRISRQSLLVAGLRELPRRWFTLALGLLQQNDELNLDLRSLVGRGSGRYNRAVQPHDGGGARRARPFA